MGSRSPKAIEFRSKLGFSQYDIILKKRIISMKIISNVFVGENMQTQYNVLGYKIDLYFHDYKLAIEVDGKGHRDRNIDHEIKRQKAIEEKLDCKFIRIDPDEENFNVFKAQNEVFRHIKKSNKKLNKKSTNKPLINELTSKLLKLELEKILSKL